MTKVNFFCDLPCAVFAGGAEVLNQPCVAPRSGKMTVSVLPAYENVPRLSYTLILDFDEGILTSCTGGAQVLDWGKGEYDVILSPPTLPFRHSPVTLAQSGNGSFATLYDDGEMHLMCEGAGFIVRDVPRLTRYSLTSSERGEFLAVLTGQTHDKDYFLALSLASGGKVLHEHLADGIEATEHGVIVRENILDMKRRKRVTTYLSGGAISAREFTRTERSFPAELVPYALLEAVQARDEEDILSLVSADLADASAVCEFFGDFDVICPPKCAVPPLSVAIYSRGEGVTVPRVFAFSVADGVVTSVNEISIP